MKFFIIFGIIKWIDMFVPRFVASNPLSALYYPFSLYPLMKESFFTNNHNGRNFGGDGEIAIVDDDGNTIEIINEDEVESGGF
jgi:hypothetical protein